MKRGDIVAGAFALALQLLSFDVQSALLEDGDFTGAQRKAFVEAPEQFPKFVLPRLKPMGGALWLDNDHLIMSVRELPNGWRADKDALPPTPLSPVEELPPRASRMIVVDVNSGAITDAPYAGQLVCVDNGNIVVSLTKPGVHGTQYYAGRYGARLSLLTAVTAQRPTFGAGCELAYLKDEFWNYPLGPGAGLLRVHRTSDFQFDVNLPAVLVDSSGQIRREFEAPKDMLPPDIEYLPYLRQYVLEKYDASHHVRAGALMTVDGTLSPIAPDPFLHEIVESDGGEAPVRYTRRGPLWSLRPVPRMWRQQGLYLRDGGRLLRLESQSTVGIQVSPDGCRVFYRRVPGDPNFVLGTVKEWSTAQLIVMTICKP